MLTSNSKFEIYERQLLNGYRFNDEQINFINSDNSQFVLANPGAGKTTALTIKAALLLDELNQVESKKGICIITYTNIAVKEIEDNLKMIGIGKLQPPHFIGTLHDFLSTFALNKFLELYNIKFTMFEDIQKNRYSFKIMTNYLSRTFNLKEEVSQSIVRRASKYPLIPNDFNKFTLDNTDSWHLFDRHVSKMIDAHLYKIKNGIIRYDDVFSISYSYFMLESNKKRILNRFGYIFVDEFQDTNKLGIKLLKEVFYELGNIQFIGDLNQSIYNDNTVDIHPEEILKLKKTTRFSKFISNPLNRINIKNKIDPSLHVNSLKPILLLYRSKDNIIHYYKKWISYLEEINDEFNRCSDDDMILFRYKKWINSLDSTLSLTDIRETHDINHNYILEDFNKFIFQTIDKSFTSNYFSFLKSIKSLPPYHDIKKVIIRYLKFSVYDREYLIEKIHELLGYYQENDLSVIAKITDRVIELMKKFDNNKSDSSLQYSSIHSTKGENLRSALIFEDDSDVVHHHTHLSEILNSLYSSKYNSNYSTLEKNLLYVGLSRSRYLNIYAIPAARFSNESYYEMSQDWNVICII